MNKSKKKALLSVTLTLVLFISVFAFVPAKKVEATNYTFAYKTYELYYTGESSLNVYDLTIVGGENLKSSQIKSLTVSNSVVKVYARNGGRIKIVVPNKNLTFQVSCKIGKRFLSTKVVSKRIPGNPFKLFKIGTTNYASRFKTSETYYHFVPITKLSQVVVQVKPGWVITGYKYVNTGSASKVKSGLNMTKLEKKLKFNGAESVLKITLFNKKTEMTRQYTFYYVD